MKQDKLYEVAVPIVVSLICIVLVVNLAITGSQLNAERAKVADLNRQIVDVSPQLTEQARLVSDLQSSLEDSEVEIEGLRAANRDLEARLSAQASAPAAE